MSLLRSLFDTILAEEKARNNPSGPVPPSPYPSMGLAPSPTGPFNSPGGLGGLGGSGIWVDLQTPAPTSKEDEDVSLFEKLLSAGDRVDDSAKHRKNKKDVMKEIGIGGLLAMSNAARQPNRQRRQLTPVRSHSYIQFLLGG